MLNRCVVYRITYNTGRILWESRQFLYYNNVVYRWYHGFEWVIMIDSSFQEEKQNSYHSYIVFGKNREQDYCGVFKYDYKCDFLFQYSANLKLLDKKLCWEESHVEDDTFKMIFFKKLDPTLCEARGGIVVLRYVISDKITNYLLLTDCLNLITMKEKQETNEEKEQKKKEVEEETNEEKEEKKKKKEVEEEKKDEEEKDAKEELADRVTQIRIGLNQSMGKVAHIPGLSVKPAHLLHTIIKTGGNKATREFFNRYNLIRCFSTTPTPSLLRGDPKTDDAVRSPHRYDRAPDIFLLKESQDSDALARKHQQQIPPVAVIKYSSLTTCLVFERGSPEAAEKLAEIMFPDFVHEVISACVPPVYPSRFGHGWACIPLVASSANVINANHLLISSARGACPSHVSNSLAPAGIARYHLQLDIIKHLFQSSPVRAVLACVFGSSILYNSSESSILSSLNEELLQSPDADRMFYEFALDQSERFPTLNRWIQMQTNLHRVSEFAVTSKDTDDVNVMLTNRNVSVKRPREHDTDTESEFDDSAGRNTVASVPEVAQATADRETLQDSINCQAAEEGSAMFLTFDWGNEEPYEKALQRLIEEGNLMDALALSDRFLRGGASDQLLTLLIEHEEKRQNFGSLSGHLGNLMLSNSWQYCLRSKDKQLAAQLALRFLHRWELDAALDVLTMCSCHLPQDEPIKNEVHFFLKRKDSNLSDAEVSRLNSWALGLRVLSALPLPWQQRCSSLHEHPRKIFEVLLMRRQLESSSLESQDSDALAHEQQQHIPPAAVIKYSSAIGMKSTRSFHSMSKPLLSKDSEKVPLLSSSRPLAKARMCSFLLSTIKRVFR